MRQEQHSMPHTVLTLPTRFTTSTGAYRTGHTSYGSYGANCNYQPTCNHQTVNTYNHRRSNMIRYCQICIRYVESEGHTHPEKQCTGCQQVKKLAEFPL